MKNQIDLIQSIPGSWATIDVLVDGEKKYTACKTIGPGVWLIYDSDINCVGSATSKSQIKTAVRAHVKI